MWGCHRVGRFVHALETWHRAAILAELVLVLELAKTTVVVEHFLTLRWTDRATLVLWGLTSWEWNLVSCATSTYHHRLLPLSGLSLQLDLPDVMLRLLEAGHVAFVHHLVLAL